MAVLVMPGTISIAEAAKQALADAGFPDGFETIDLLSRCLPWLSA